MPFFFVGMETMKKNKGKRLANEESVQKGEDVHFHPHQAASEKRKALSKFVDVGSLPSCQGNKKPRHGSSKSGVIKTGPFIPSTIAKQPSAVKTPSVYPSNPPDVTSSNPPTWPPDSGPMTLLRIEGLAWDRFKQAITEKDVAICYDTFVKEFERSTVHDLFKVL